MSSPAQYLAQAPACAAMAASTAASSASASIASKPLAAAIAAGSPSPPAATTSASTCLACVGVTVPATSSAVSAASAAGVTGSGPSGGEVVLDVDEHPRRIAAGLDGAGRQPVAAPLDGDGDRLVGGVHARGRGQGGPALGGQGRQGRADLLDPRRVGRQRHEVGLGEVAVVVGVLLRAERVGAAVVLVPVARLLADDLPVAEQHDLPARLVLDRTAERAHRVEVLDLATSAEGSPGRRTDTLASTRIEPSSILASEASMATRMARSSFTYWRASSAVRMSGRPTISTSGTPARL